jgi:site-specific DNA-cytosine methylase
MRILKEVKPTYFFLENVVMVEKWEKILSKAIGVNPIKINSALVSAQNRERLYWTNIGMIASGLFGDLESIIKQPKDKKILLRDILQDNPNSLYYLNEQQVAKVLNKTGVNPNIDEAAALDVYNNKIKEDGKSPTLTDPCHNSLRLIEPKKPDEKYYLSEQAKERINRHNNKSLGNEKSATINAGYYKQGGRDQQYVDEKYYLSETMLNYFKTHNERHLEKGTGFLWQPTEGDKKANTLRANGALCATDNSIISREVKQINDSNKKSNSNTQPYQQDRIYDPNGISPALSANKSDLLIPDNSPQKVGYIKDTDSQGNRVYSENGGAVTLQANGGGLGAKTGLYMMNNSRIRRLTPVECERLQTVSDDYTKYVSDTQRYKMLGNGWTIDVIAHIFAYLKK